MAKNDAGTETLSYVLGASSLEEADARAKQAVRYLDETRELIGAIESYLTTPSKHTALHVLLELGDVWYFSGVAPSHAARAVELVSTVLGVHKDRLREAIAAVHVLKGVSHNIDFRRH